MTKRHIGKVLQERVHEWIRIPGVEGAAIGEHHGAQCIRIFTSINPQDLRDRIPSDVEGYPVIIEKTGRFGTREQNE